MRFIYSKTFAKVFTIFVLLSLLAIADARGYMGIVKDGFLRAYGYSVTKVTGVTSSVKVSFSTLFTIRKLAFENSQLNQEVNQLAFENARLKSARDENAALRKALNFQQQSDLNLLPVEVLTLDPTGFSQTIVIDKGENFEIKLNQPIIMQPGLLVGKVIKVNPNTAEVMLITDPTIVINGEVVDSQARGLIKGEHGLGLSFDLVTQNELIKTGDEVITSGLSNDFPRGILIGSITAIRSSTTDLFQKAFVSPAANLRNIRFLFAVI
jgi:rod shape-determining protein MreC